MPHLGHSLAGIGIAGATAEDARSPWLRHTWFGFAVTLAYLPDLLEWGAVLLGFALPHAALASVPATALYCVVLILFLRYGLGEKSRAILIAAVIAVASHSFLDCIQSGIPLWWPFSAEKLGPHWLPRDGDPLGGGLVRELFIFAPLAGLGIVVGMWRKWPSSAWSWAAAGLLLTVLAAALAASVLAMAAGAAALAGLALAAHRRRPGWRDLLQIPPLAPVVLLAGVQFYAAEQMRLGLQYHQRGDFAGALPYYQRAARFRPLEMEAAECRVAMCYAHLGREAEAYDIFVNGLKLSPDAFDFMDGLASLCLSARDPRFRDPPEAARLAGRMVALARDPASLAYAERMLERARQMVAARK